MKIGTATIRGKNRIIFTNLPLTKFEFQLVAESKTAPSSRLGSRFRRQRHYSLQNRPLRIPENLQNSLSQTVDRRSQKNRFQCCKSLPGNINSRQTLSKWKRQSRLPRWPFAVQTLRFAGQDDSRQRGTVGMGRNCASFKYWVCNIFISSHWGVNI